MISKKFIFILIILLGLIFSISYLFTSLTPLEKIRLGIVKLPGSIKTETNVELAIQGLVSGKDRTLISPVEGDICYWIKPTHNGTHYLLQINEYKSTLERCIGFPLGKEEIILDHGINILGGNSCVCGGETYLLEWESGGLRITRG